MTEQAPLAAPLQPGDILASRYRIQVLVSSSPSHNCYKAIDLAYCKSCGDESNQEADQYCRNCGAELEPRRTICFEELVRQVPTDFDIHLDVDQRDYYGVIELDAKPAGPTSHPASEPSRIRWGLATDRGNQRDRNEDYLEGWIYSRNLQPLLALFIVADGLGGQDSGEVASRMTADTIWQQIQSTLLDRTSTEEGLPVSQIPDALRSAVLEANTHVYHTRLERGSQMSSTLTAALICGSGAFIANVGDSRTYIFGSQGLTRITKDHSLVQRLVDAGQIEPEEIYTHPRRNLIYQSIGDRPDVQVDLYSHELEPDDRLLLCSDGLWEMVHEDGIEEVLLAEADPQQACDRLVRNANLAGGEDNISVIIVQMLS